MNNQIALKSKANDIRSFLGSDAIKSQIALALPKHITPDRLLRVTMTAVQSNPALLDCTRESLAKSLIQCAQLGLEPDGILGQAYLVPFKNNKAGTTEVQFIPGYRGYITLARNSGEVQSILAKAVYKNDHFKVAFHLDPEFEHIPALEGERGEITHFWALVKFKDGGHHFDYMTRAEVEKVRDEHSAGYKIAKTKGGWLLQETPWVKHFEAMGLKTIIRRIAKYLPMSVQKLATIEETRETGGKIEIDAFGDIASIEYAETANAPEVEQDKKTKLDVFESATAAVQVDNGSTDAPIQADDADTPKLVDEQPAEIATPVAASESVNAAGMILQINKLQAKRGVDAFLNITSKKAMDYLYETDRESWARVQDAAEAHKQTLFK